MIFHDYLRVSWHSKYNSLQNLEKKEKKRKKYNIKKTFPIMVLVTSIVSKGFLQTNITTRIATTTTKTTTKSKLKQKS